MSEAAAELARVLGTLVPRAAVVAVEYVPEHSGRKAEHDAGRRAVRRALDQLGRIGEPDGAMGSRPLWPPGVVGSISHARGYAVAVVSDDDVSGAIGVDIDEAEALPARDAAVVCSDTERQAIDRHQDGPSRDAFATLVWTAKEAAFKAWDGWSDGRLWGVDPALLAVECTDDGRVVARAAEDVADRCPGLPELAGRWARSGPLVGVVVAAPPRPPMFVPSASRGASDR